MRDRTEQAETYTARGETESTLAAASSTHKPCIKVVPKVSFWLILAAVFVLVLAAAGYYDWTARGGRKNSGYPS